MIFGMVCSYPTSPAMTERELVMAGYVLQRCKDLGHPGIFTVFTDFKRDLGEGKHAFAWAKPGGDYVTVYRPDVNDEETYPNHVLDAYAKHECCHIAGHEDQAAAGQCVRAWE